MEYKQASKIVRSKAGAKYGKSGQMLLDKLVRKFLSPEYKDIPEIENVTFSRQIKTLQRDAGIKTVWHLKEAIAEITELEIVSWRHGKVELRFRPGCFELLDKEKPTVVLNAERTRAIKAKKAEHMRKVRADHAGQVATQRQADQIKAGMRNLLGMLFFRLIKLQPLEAI